MSSAQLDIVILGLSITSSWGNGHATTYRGLVRELAARGHGVLFLERDVPWYASHRDFEELPHARVVLYRSLEELVDLYTEVIRRADLVMVGSYVIEGARVGRWVTATTTGVSAFYDIDTPVTLARLESEGTDYLTPELVPLYELYLSFTGGDTLVRLERELGSPMARALYCSADPTSYFPDGCAPELDLGYMGTYSEDRQPALEALLVEPARRWPEASMVVAGPLYPDGLEWPPNIARREHVPPGEHREFYCRQRFTLNITRSDMIRAGHSPSVRLFEAAACATPLITDNWRGLDTFFVPGREILVSRSPAQTLRYLREMPEAERVRLGRRARARVLAQHTAAHRAAELERHVLDAFALRTRSRRYGAAR